MAEREVLGLKKLLVAVVTESSLSRAATGRVSVEAVASITTITIALFFGAFRRFKDNDPENTVGGVLSAYNTFNDG